MGLGDHCVMTFIERWLLYTLLFGEKRVLRQSFAFFLILLDEGLFLPGASTRRVALPFYLSVSDLVTNATQPVTEARRRMASPPTSLNLDSLQALSLSRTSTTSSLSTNRSSPKHRSSPSPLSKRQGRCRGGAKAALQIQFYFTAQNLHADSFLRSHMDSQGFVPVAFLASFPAGVSVSKSSRR